MKICPHCQTQYTDDTLQFCLQDGSPLDDFSGRISTSAVSDGEQETVVKSRTDENLPVWQTPSGAANYQTAERKSNTALIIAVTALTTLLIFAAGIAAWLYFGGENETAKDTTVKNSFPDNSTKNKSENLSGTTNENPGEKPSVKPTTRAPEFDAETVKSEVSDAIGAWVSRAESRDLSAYMNSYAERVDYYRKRGASIGFVRNDKQKAFSTYNNIEIDISNMRVSPDASGETATVVFDKAWRFEGVEKTSEGKVQQQLQFRKTGGAWKITGERDLKVYYVN